MGGALEQAEKQLGDKGLPSARCARSPATSPPARWCANDPRAQELARQGSGVVLWVSMGPGGPFHQAT